MTYTPMTAASGLACDDESFSSPTDGFFQQGVVIPEKVSLSAGCAGIAGKAAEGRKAVLERFFRELSENAYLSMSARGNARPFINFIL